MEGCRHMHVVNMCMCMYYIVDMCLDMHMHVIDMCLDMHMHVVDMCLDMHVEGYIRMLSPHVLYIRTYVRTFL